jgi:filamentous hemagglutinin family protein
MVTIRRARRSVPLRVAIRAALRGVVVGIGALPGAQAAPPLLPPAPSYTPPATTALPTPCSASLCATPGSSPTSWLTSGTATYAVAGGKLTINQTSANAALNWSTFNIGPKSSVIFNQPSATAIAINEIFQSAPSQIFGALKANGQIYLINQNGFIFGANSTVNVGGLLASTLALAPNAAQNGILDPALLEVNAAALVGDGRAGVTNLEGALVDTNGAPLAAGAAPVPVEIVVQPGAQLATNASNERLLLASPTIDNGGSLSAPSGQIVLAAGQQVFLAASADPNLRGLLVEVDGGGAVTNAATGSLTANLGNISVVGLAVNQLGRVSATTSVTQNGSIYLLAQDTVAVSEVAGNFQLTAERGGTATLGPGSVTQVTPDSSGGTTVDAVVQPVSTINVAGQYVYFEGGSTTRAHGGAVNVTAGQSPSDVTGPPEAASIRVDPGALIDVSGDSTSVPVTRNILQVELTATELADDPYQRGGILEDQVVYVNAQTGTPLANISGEVALIQRGIDERTAGGGTVSLNSAGDVVLGQGSTINVSGGQVNYTPGYVQTTQLVTSTGQVVDIGSASPTATYVGVYNPNFQQVSNRWGVVTEVSTGGVGRYNPGYVQGANAGTIEITAPGALVLQGTLLGSAVAGINQRTPATLPQGGHLIIGNPGATDDLRAPPVEIVVTPEVLTIADSSAVPAGTPLELGLQAIINDGFDRLAIGSNTSVTLEPGTPLALGPAGTLTLTGPRVEIDSSITAPGGSIAATSFAPANTAAVAPPLAQQGVYVADGVTFDVRGNWTNDAIVSPSVVVTSAALVNGGSVALNGGGTTLSVGNDVDFELSGGAWLERNNKLTLGAGGGVSLVDGPNGTVTVGSGIRFDAFGAEGARGGSFTLSAPRIEVETGAGAWSGAQSATPTGESPFTVGGTLFSSFGFSAISLVADGPRLPSDVTATTLSVVATPGGSGVLEISPATYPMTNALFLAPSAPSLAGIESPAATPAYRAQPSSLSLSAVVALDVGATPESIGGITIGAGTHIEVGVGGSVTLATVGSTLVQGDISAPGGTITIDTLTPSATYDPGYLPGLRIELGPTSALDVSGTTVYTPNPLGLYSGTTYSGGTINLIADRGSVVTDGGSVLNFAGTSAVLDVQTPALGSVPVREVVATGGGTLNIVAPESISLTGTLNGAAGKGSTGAAPGGTLNVTLSRLAGFEADNFVFPSNPRTILFETGAPPEIVAADSGLAILDPRALAASGIDALFTSSDEVSVAAGTNLAFGREVVLQAPALSVAGTSSITAPYVSLGGGSTALATQSATTGTGSLVVDGTETLTLSGNLALQGAGNVTFTTPGVLELVGNYLQGTLPAAGQLQVGGNLNVDSSAVEMATATAYTITAQSGVATTPFTVSFRQTGPAPAATPLSVAGSLTVNGDVISQGGTIRAPFGTISLNGTGSVTLLPGSVTSVSADGATLPYGIVEPGNSWVYGSVQSLAQPISGVPARQVTLNAPTVTIGTGSKVDLAGGGDLYAYEWIPGPGGTADALSPTVSPGLYAVLPSLAGQFAPYDVLQYANSSLQPGQSVYLSGGGGIAAGFYPLLPARYGLLPGAFLVSVASGYANLPTGTVATAANGAPIVAGYFSFGNTGIGGNETQGFVIEPGSFSHQLADYQNNYASSFFPASATAAGQPAPVTPADAGALDIETSALLAASGSVIASGAKGGQGGLVEIASPNAIVVSAPGVASAGSSGTVVVDAATLESWNPGQILLGGVYVPGASPTVTTSAGGASTATNPATVNVVSNSVIFEPGATLTASEIVLVAANGIALGSGAAIESTSANAATPLTGLPVRPVSLTGPAATGAAFLGVSDLGELQPDHPAAQSADTNAGSISLQPGSLVGSRGSLALDAPGGATVPAGAMTGNGAAWSIGGAAQVVFGSALPAGAPANSLLITPALAAEMSDGSSVRIATAGDVAFNGDLSFAPSRGSMLSSVTILASDLVELGTAGSVRFEASSVTLSGTGNGAAAAAGNGTFEVDADTLTLGPGLLFANGFAQVTLAGTRSVTGSGAGGLTSAGNLTVNAPYLTALGDSNTTLAAGGTLTVGPGGAVPARALLPTGGTLSLTGQSVVDDGTILMPSGVLSVSSNSGVTFGATSVVDVGGTSLAAAAAAYGTPGGLVTVSAAGDVTQAAGSRIEVGGGPASVAGIVSITATGVVDLNGTLDSSGPAGAKGVADTGSFYVNAGSLADFTALNAALEAGGFGNTRSFRTATGDLALAAGTTLTANDVLLEADGGSITLAGTINASSTGARPQIEVDAGTGLTLAATAVLEANALGATTKGGSITLSTAAGTLAIDPNASFSATGGASTALPSELVLRAPALASDVAISGLPANTANLGGIVIEPWSVFALPSGAPNAGVFTGDAAAVSAYLGAAAPQISSRLGLGSNAVISPFVQFSYAGDLTLPALALDGPTWRFNGAPATLAFTATGNLTVAGTISDGFATVTGPGTKVNFDIDDTASSSLVLTAGASAGAASASAVASGGSADLTLNPGVVVRTGTGSVSLAAPQDVVFSSLASVYTGGVGESLTINNLNGSVTGLPLVFATFPTDGGSISIAAGRDVVANPSATGNGLSLWQPRIEVPGATAASWGTNFSSFHWTVGALGGGDVTINAGRDVNDLEVAAADNAQTSPGGALVYYGGGNLVVEAGRNVDSSAFYVGQGSGSVAAYGSLAENRADPARSGALFGNVLFAGDASFRVQAVGDVYFEGEVPASLVYEESIPTVDFLRLTPTDTLSVTSAGGNLDLTFGNPSIEVVIGTKESSQTNFTLKGLLPSTTSLIAAGGGISLLEGPVLLPADRGQLVVYAAQNITGLNAGTPVQMSDAPDAAIPTALNPELPGVLLQASSITTSLSGRHTGDPDPVVVYAGGAIQSLDFQLPKALDLYAGQNITDVFLTIANTNASDVSVEATGGNIATSFASINSSDQIYGGGSFDMIAGKGIDLGFSGGVTTLGNLGYSYLTTASGANVTILAGLGQPLGVGAPGSGTHSDFVTNVIEDSLNPATGKPLYQQALINYVTSLGYAPANVAAAANDFRGLTLPQQLPLLSSVLFQELVRSGQEFNALPVPTGQAAGGNGQLGAALNNSNLAKLIDYLILPSPVYQQELIGYVEDATGRTNLSFAQALSTFEQLPPALQVAFRYVRGYTAISDLFPGTNPFDALVNYVIATDPTIAADNAASHGTAFPGVANIPPNPYSGNFAMTLGRVYTLDGGTIDILTPGGGVDVGQATTPPAVSQLGIVREPSQLGIVTEGAGDINILTLGNVEVDSSRIFTLGGGNIAIWSSAGNIDAGAGAKSAISAPPPVVTVSADGQVNVSFDAAVSGSGIRTIITDPTAPAGDVSLIAPIGTVNAGDAGIGAAGNLNIAASSVAGLNNITVGGTSTGVPPVASGVGVTVAGAANAASSSSASSTAAVAPAAGGEEQKAPLAQAALSWLDVFVIGLGEEGCRPDDLECLRRQPTH